MKKHASLQRQVKEDIHPLVVVITDPKKKRGLTFICNWLEKLTFTDYEGKKHTYLELMYYGCGGRPLLFTEVREILEAIGGKNAN